MDITRQIGSQLSDRLDQLVADALGQHLALVCLVRNDDGSLGIFTNCQKTSEVLNILETGLYAVKTD